MTYQTFTSPIGGTIYDRPCQVITYDGSANRMAETDYLYDNGTTVCGTAGTPSVADVPTLPTGTHDETNYSATSTTSRGNVTKKTQWLSGGTSPATTYTYDKTGQVLTMIDPCGNGTCSDMTGGAGHTTTFSYTDAFTVLSGGSNIPCTSGCPASGATNAYLTKVTDALSHAASFTYDFYSGQLTASTDANSQSTGYIYNDSFARPTQFNYPDGGQAEHAYNDTSSPPTVTSCQLITGTAGATCSPTTPPSGWKTSVGSLDGLGHVVQEQVASDPDGVDSVDTSYDGLGRVHTRSNPHRTAAATTDGTTTYTYDVLGRTTKVTEPDGSTVQTTYSGNQTTVIDEVGNQRKTQADGLGRLTAVWEAPNATGYNYETDYQYDALGNLLCAVQKGTDTTTFTNCATASATWRPRSFVYDSLSRLTSATNPESGNITYSYDLNGNLSTKVAPKPNQTGSATVTTTNTYDKLNRLTKKSYNDGSTPTVQFAYDGATLTGCTPNPPAVVADVAPVGRRTAMCDGSGATAWSHDPMGRVIQEGRFIAAVTPAKLVNYGYNLDGSLQYLTTPPLKTIVYSYNGAGHATKAVDSIDGINFVTGATYTPPGELASMTMGSATGFAGIVTTNAYNDRLQPILMSAGVTGQNPVFSECFDFHLGVAINTSPCAFSKSTAGDNGNVYQVVNNRDNTRSQIFLYDTLNRIQQGNSSGTQWGDKFTIDAWGNMTNEAAVANKTNHEGLNCPANTNNQLTTCSFGYDAAGNMTNNGMGTTYTYDAENRLTWSSGYKYVYDGNGERVEKCMAGTPTTACPTSGTNGTLYWKGTGSDALDESDLSGNQVEEYIFFNGQRIARRDLPSNAIHYYFSDHLGSHGVIENATATSCEQDIDYYPYGGVEHDYCSASGVAQNYKFTGKERDAESGLDNFGARFNASSTGRFMSSDPGPFIWRDPQTLNRYTYTRNNPLKFVDPTGMYFVVAAQDQKFFQKALSDIYRRPGGRELINTLATSNKPVLLDRGEQNTATTGHVASSTALAIMGTPGVSGVHTTVGTDSNLLTGERREPDKVGPAKTTAHELEHDKDGLAAGQNSLAAGAAAMENGDAPRQAWGKGHHWGNGPSGRRRNHGRKARHELEGRKRRCSRHPSVRPTTMGRQSNASCAV